MTKPNIAGAATKIVELLTPFDSDERKRAVQAAMTLLGESPISPPNNQSRREHADDGTLPLRAQSWLHQNGVGSDQLEQVFHTDGESAEVIAASIPGKTDKERTLNAYVLTGIARLVGTGDPSFDDKNARQVCKNLGCYNDTNHASYIKDKGNRIAGSKNQGWKLTAPGLAHGASLIKELASSPK